MVQRLGWRLVADLKEQCSLLKAQVKEFMVFFL